MIDLNQTLKEMSKYDNIRMLAPINAGHRILNALNEIFRALNIHATVVERGRLHMEPVPREKNHLWSPGDGSVVIATDNKQFIMRIVIVRGGETADENLLKVDIVGLHTENICYFNEGIIAMARILGQGFSVREIPEQAIARIREISSKPMAAVDYVVFG